TVTEVVQALVSAQMTPVAVGDKKPLAAGWEKKTPAGAEADFQDPRTIGVGLLLNGGLADIDCEVPASAKAKKLLLQTDSRLVWGRPGLEESHALCRAIGTIRPMKFTAPKAALPDDAEKATLIELRTGNQQTVLPPSPHLE